ncbi:MAG: TIGR02597 family protein [Kiritimatiellales bacterium]
MKIKASAITAAALAVMSAQAETVGYNTVAVLANSDTVISAPFNPDVKETFTVSAVVSGGITVNESLAADTYDSGYFVRFTSGGAEGLWSTISANGNGGFELANTNVLANVGVDDAVEVFAHNTVASLFPASMKDESWDSQTQLLLVDNDTVSTMKPQEAISYRSTGSQGAGWYKGPTYKGNVVITPGEYVVVRNQSANEYVFVAYGDVPASKVGQILPAGQTDVYVAGFPVPVTVSELGLEGEYQILLIDNDSTGYMKPQEALSYRTTGSNGAGWYKGPTYRGDSVIAAGTGFILRRASDSIDSEWAEKPY